MVAAFKEMRASGWGLQRAVRPASHPASEASPSPTDLREAYYPDAIMLIVSFAGTAPGRRAVWRLCGVLQERRFIGMRSCDRMSGEPSYALTPSILSLALSVPERRSLQIVGEGEFMVKWLQDLSGVDRHIPSQHWQGAGEGLPSMLSSPQRDVLPCAAKWCALYARVSPFSGRGSMDSQ